MKSEFKMKFSVKMSVSIATATHAKTNSKNCAKDNYIQEIVISENIFIIYTVKLYLLGFYIVSKYGSAWNIIIIINNVFMNFLHFDGK